MPCANISWTGPQIAKSDGDPLRHQVTRTVPENFSRPTPDARFWGHIDPYLPRDQDTYPARPSRQPARPTSRAGPCTHPTYIRSLPLIWCLELLVCCGPQHTSNPKSEEAERNLLLSRIDIPINISARVRIIVMQYDEKLVSIRCPSLHQSPSWRP